MKTITKEYNVLEISDIEKSVSKYLGKPTSINEMRCSFVYLLADDYSPYGMEFLLFVRGENVTSYDLFYDEEKNGYYLNGDRLGLDEPWLPINEVFNFDTSAFRFFRIYSEWEWKSARY